MTHSPSISAKTHPSRSHNKGLILVAAYSVLKATLFLAVGIGALRLLHQDAADVLLDLARELRVDPNSHFVNALLQNATLFTDERLRTVSAFVFGYAALNIIEGVGLFLEKVWAEYLTLLVTASFMPLEIIELLHRQTAIPAGLLVVNVVVLAILGAVLYARRQRQQASAGNGPEAAGS